MNQKKRIIKLITGKSIMLLLLILFSFSIKSQVNLVPNPSFEQLDSCVSDFQNPSNWLYMPAKLATPWDTLKNGGGYGNILCNECFNPNPSIGVPKNISTASVTFQYPRTGKGYLYVVFFKLSSPSVSWRSYAQVPLTTTLTNGKAYCVTFYASLSNRWITAIDELSAYFDNGSIQSVAPMKEAIANPQIKSPPGVFMMDTLNWMKVQGTFVANGTESHLTIGNFRTFASTNYTILTNPGGSCEYYIDDVSVIELNLPAYAGPDKTIMLGDSTFIGRPPEIGLDCTWYNGTVNIGSGAGIWVKPAVTTTYVVQQDICGLIKTDTVNVIVNYVGINENSVDSKFVKLYPNPTNGEFTLESGYANIELKEVEIIDVTGRTVFKKELNSRKTNLQPNLNNGIYFITLRVSNNETITKKLVIAK